MAISFAAISNFFADEMKLIERAENALKSNRLRGFTFHGLNGVIKATVGASMKKASYSVMVSRLTIEYIYIVYWYLIQ